MEHYYLQSGNLYLNRSSNVSNRSNQCRVMLYAVKLEEEEILAPCVCIHADLVTRPTIDTSLHIA